MTCDLAHEQSFFTVNAHLTEMLTDILNKAVNIDRFCGNNINKWCKLHFC